LNNNRLKDQDDILFKLISNLFEENGDEWKVQTQTIFDSESEDEKEHEE